MRREEGSLSFDEGRQRWIGRYWVTLPSGRRQRKQVSHANKNEARRLLNRAMLAARDGEIQDASPTVAKWMERFVQRKRDEGKSLRTIEASQYDAKLVTEALVSA